MANETPTSAPPTETRALSAALAAPAFTTRTGGLAMHAASRHVERWAPETDAGRMRPMRSLGFVDRLVAPWIETAQRSAGLRMFSQYIGNSNSGFAEREPGAVSWVFPRPWYQDELDWMAAARHVARPMATGGGEQRRDAQPAMLTTRGTYVPPARPASVPAQLMEYVAPSLSIARGPMPIAGVDGFAPSTARDVYSPLVPLAAVQAAMLVQRTMAALTAPTIAPSFSTPATRPNAPQTMAPALRSVLATMLARATTQPQSPGAAMAPHAFDRTPPQPVTSRWAMTAPALETPPAPRLEARPGELSASLGADEAAVSAYAATPPAQAAERMATQLAEQRVRVVELQRAAQQAMAREVAARVEQRAASTSTTAASTVGASPEAQRAQLEAVAQQRAQVEVAQQRAIAQRAAESLAATQQTEAQRAAQTTAQTTAQTAAQTTAQTTAESARAANQTEAQRAQAEVARVEQQQLQVRLDERVAQRIAERTAEQRATGEQQQRAAVATAVEQQQQRAAVGAQRLHEQARTEAARDARVAPVAPAREPERIEWLRTESRAVSDRNMAQSQAAVAALAAAMSGPLAALAPELAAIVGARPERAAQVIGELSEALRAAELMSRAAASGQAFEATRGPRLTMPAGLGGLVATVDRAHAADRPTAAPIGMTRAAASAPGAPALAPRRDDLRVPTLSWVTAGGARNFEPARAAAPTSALGATAASSPHALQHVAWADRWLARFAGAAPTSLAALDQASTMAPLSLGIAGVAPGAVFVAPMFDGPVGQAAQAAQVAAQAQADGGSSPSTGTSGPTSTFGSTPTSTSTSMSMSRSTPEAPTAPAPTLMRFDDTQETPDDVFAAISAAASRSRAPQAHAAAVAAGRFIEPTLVVPTAPIPTERGSYADAIAHAVPVAPNAGLSAQLASSPFAPALRHMLPMPAAASFDVRALFGGALSATYLAGLLGASSREIASVPAGLPWSPLAASADLGTTALPAPSTREAPAWDATYVAPELSAGVAASDLAAFGEAASEPSLPSSSSSSSATGAGHALTASGPDAVAPAAFAAESFAQQRALAQAMPAMTTLRSALLSWDVEIPAAATASAPYGATSVASPQAASAASPAGSAGTARSMIEAMAMPMLGDSPPGAAAMWSAPGMVADRAQSWSVAQERSSADLSFDFVTPELVLAARVYGLGPAEAAQAARLAIAGPGQLTAMAGMVDRTFVQAMAADAERRDAATASARAISAYPVTSNGELAATSRRAPAAASSASSTAIAASAARSAALDASSTAPASPTAEPSWSPEVVAPAFAAALPSTGASFGVERRMPRGAFLWPSATVAALNLNAAAPDGQMSMSVAALELLAAQAVAEIGTYAAFTGELPGPRGGAAADAADAAGSATDATESSTGATGAISATATDAPLGSPLAAVRAAAAARAPELAALTARGDVLSVPIEASEQDVLAGATALVPMARRARFEAMYVALGQSHATRTLSPAARAARALALAGRGDDAPTTTRERATAAWDVLPVVYAMGDAAPSTTIETGATAARQHAARQMQRGQPGQPGSPNTRATSAPGTASYGFAEHGISVDTRPGLSALSARAGEALGSYVTPMAAPAPAPAQAAPRETGAVLRAPTAAQELVRTGRPAGRYGGGEVEIPTWFENAARRMFEDKGNVSDGISLSELTLVSSAPQSHIAASTRSAPSAAPAAPSPDSGAPVTASFDIDKIAHEVYRQILVLMDNVRARNGEPFL